MAQALIFVMPLLGFGHILTLLVNPTVRSIGVPIVVAVSDAMELEHMVYQGTVLGPCFWNLHYGDARYPIQNSGFREIVFADDSNAFKCLTVVLWIILVDLNLSLLQISKPSRNQTLWYC